MHNSPSSDSIGSGFSYNDRKITEKDSTSVKIKELTPDERMAEIARMLSGKITDVSLKHAGELLERSA